MDLKPGSDLRERLAVTAAAIALWRVAIHLPLPGVDLQALSEFTALGGGLSELPQMSLLALGLGPYISASVVVEVFALFLNPLKAWRSGGPAGRLRLRQMAYVAALVLALVQGYAIASSLANMPAPGGGVVTVFSGPAGRVLMALTMAGGTFFLLALAGLITRRGMGHGVSLLIFCAVISGVGSQLLFVAGSLTAPDGLELIGEFGHFGRLLAVLGGAALLLGGIALLVIVERATRRIPVIFPDGVETAFPLRLMPAGIVPVSWSLSLLIIPLTVIQFVDPEPPQWLVESLLPGGMLREIAGLVLIVFFSLFFTSLFHRPRRLVDDLEARGGRFVTPPGETAASFLDRRLLILALFGGLYLGLLELGGNLMYLFFGAGLQAVSLLLVAAIALDLYSEGHLRLRYGRLVRVAEFHDVNRAALVESLVQRQGIPCVLRGGRHRGLLYFFGPYVEISLLVPEGRREESWNVAAPFLGS